MFFGSLVLFDGNISWKNHQSIDVFAIIRSPFLFVDPEI